MRQTVPQSLTLFDCRQEGHCYYHYYYYFFISIIIYYYHKDKTNCENNNETDEVIIIIVIIIIIIYVRSVIGMGLLVDNARFGQCPKNAGRVSSLNGD